MPDWITTAEAAKVMSVTMGTVRRRAHNEDWPIERRKRLPPSCGLGLWLYRRSDVEKFACERAEKRTAKRMKRANHGVEAAALVAWADSLIAWPTDAEIEAQVTDVFRFKDIECVIDARVWRKDKEDKYLMPLRLPAMKVESLGKRRKR